MMAALTAAGNDYRSHRILRYDDTAGKAYGNGNEDEKKRFHDAIPWKYLNTSTLGVRFPMVNHGH